MKIFSKIFNLNSYNSDDSNDSPKGNKTKKSYSFDGVTSFNCNSVFDIVLDNHPEINQDYAVIEGYEKDLKRIELIENNGNLRVKIEDGSYSDVTIRIFTKKLSEIKLSGTGDLSGDFVGDNLSITNTGTSNIALKGMVKKLTIKNSGTGDASIADLQADNIDFTNSGTGDLHIWGVSKISGKNSGTGDVRYYGAAKSSDIKNSGIGDISYRGEKKVMEQPPKKAIVTKQEEPKNKISPDTKQEEIKNKRATKYKL